jgi:hypothetical protein
MKQLNHKLFLAAIVVAGLFVGALKGQEARTRWVSKMKTRDTSRNLNTDRPAGEVELDDFEMASFHRN